MYSQLLRTDFEANKKILLLAFVANLFFVIFLGLRGQPVESFMGISVSIYWVLLIVSVVIAGDEKRLRLYAQLPITAAEASFATWFIILAWLGMHVCFWLIYGSIFDPDFTLARVPETASAAIGVALFVVLIAIAFDLEPYRPAIIRWIYIGVLVALIGVAVFFDVSIGVVNDSEGIQILPMSLLGEGYSAISLSIVILAAALAADHYIYTHSDNYL